MADDYWKHTIALAEQALERIKALQLPAEPRNFELWYTYVAGIKPGLNERIHGLLARQRGLSMDELDQVHQQFLSNYRIIDQTEKVEAKLVDEVDQIIAMIELAMGATTQYQNELADGREKLAQPIDREMLRIIIESLVYTTKEMEQKNNSLTLSLDLSKKQIEHLHEDLASTRAESLSDPVTALANRKHFDQSLQRMIAQSKERGRIFCLVLADVDHFKTFNDIHGHQLGDRVLRFIGHQLKQSVKGQDIAARYGGEEFAIILPKTGLVAATGIAESIRRAVMAKEIRRRKDGESLGRVTLSLGVAEYRWGETADALVERADNCLYAAKRRGRNCVVAQDQLAVHQRG